MKKSVFTQYVLRKHGGFYKSGYGGIGRHDGFRIHWSPVQVRVLLSAPTKRRAVLLAVLFILKSRTRTGATAQSGGKTTSEFVVFSD